MEFEKGDILLVVDEGKASISICSGDLRNYPHPSFFECDGDKWGINIKPNGRTNLCCSRSLITKIGKMPIEFLPAFQKESMLPDSILEKIEKGDFGCRKESVKALIEEVYKAVKP